MISTFEIYKIGIGPSSSHTVGPMKAAKSFTTELVNLELIESTTKIVVDLYGALSLTGKGHLTDTATILGLAGNDPSTVDIEKIPEFMARLERTNRLPMMDNKYCVDFPLETSMNFHSEFLALHENGMTIRAYRGDELLLSKTYYSIGGGTIVDEENFGKKESTSIQVPYPFSTAEELLQQSKDNALSISCLMLKNELCMHSMEEIQNHFENVIKVMKEGIERGMKTEGLLPGGFKVPRRAPDLYRSIRAQDRLSTDPMVTIDWVNMYAFAVNEENAAGGRVVTAPTNGACGIIPAVLAYYDKFVEPLTFDAYLRFYLASSAVAMLYKLNASISGAEVGCQGEVGVACSMAAAGLAELMGGSATQVCTAAEIGMEHNLGLTCDPIGGQVQVPCIERNAIGAVKAINAARMALRRTSTPTVSLDKVIQTMYETGKDMHCKYRETSQGGLAAVITRCG